jgi:hypothetical protein
MEGNASGDVPDVLGEAVLDELLVFVLVGAHVDSVVTGVRPRLVVEHHRAPCLDSYSTVRYVFRWSSVVPVEQSRIGSPRQGGREGEGETARQWPKQARGWARAGYITVPRRESLPGRRLPRGSVRHVETRWIRLKNCDGAGPYPLARFVCLPSTHRFSLILLGKIRASLIFWQASSYPDDLAQTWQLAPPAGSIGRDSYTRVDLNRFRVPASSVARP